MIMPCDAQYGAGVHGLKVIFDWSRKFQEDRTNGLDRKCCGNLFQSETFIGENVEYLYEATRDGRIVNVSGNRQMQPYL